MLKSYFFIAIVLLVSKILFCQNNNLAPSIALASELKDKFKDKEAVCLNSFRELNFKYNKSKASYCAVLSCIEEYIFLKKDFTFSVPVVYDEFSDVINIKAPNSCIVTDEYSHSREVFHDDTRIKLFKVYVSTFGQKVKIEYEKIFYDLHYLLPSYLSGSQYPILDNQLKIIIQNNAFINLVERNFANYKIEKNITEDSKKVLKMYNYSIKNAESFNTGKNNPHISQIYPHILFHVKKMEFQKGKSEKYFENTNDLYQWYNALVKKACSSKDITVLTPIVNEIIAGKSDIEKMKAIYYWVQDKIRYIAFENGISGFMPDSACAVLNKKYGDCKGMANLLVQMLKIAGFEAHHAWIGTKGIAYDYSIPALQINNHMICAVFFNDNIYYLDATEKCSAFGEIAERIQGRDVLIENGDKYLLKKTPTLTDEINIVTKKTKIEIIDNKIEGYSSLSFMGESRANVLYILNYTKSSDIKANLINYITHDNPNFIASNVKYSPLQNYEQNFELSYNFSINNRIQSFENEHYINFDFYEEFLGSSIDTARKFDYILQIKEKITHETEITIPNKYFVSYIPENFVIENEDFNIYVVFKKNENKIIYQKTINFPNAKISTNNFKEWNNSMKLLRDFYNNQLVIKNKI